jgi:hypothetical protein
MDTASFVAAYAAIRTAQYSDEPTTKRAATRMATNLTTAIEDFANWTDDLVEAFTDLAAQAEALAEAEAEDRPDCHGEFTAAAERIVDALLDLGLTGEIVATFARVPTT